MNVNVQESLNFLRVMRITLGSLLEKSDSKNKYSYTNFILNEASDYQILSLYFLGELPKEKTNIFAEELIFKSFRKEILNNYYSLTETQSEKDLNSFLFSIGPVEHMGYSSKLNSFGQKNNISEQDFWTEVSDDFSTLLTITETIDIDKKEKTIAELCFNYSISKFEELTEQTVIKSDLLLETIIHEASIEDIEKNIDELKDIKNKTRSKEARKILNKKIKSEKEKLEITKKQLQAERLNNVVSSVTSLKLTADRTGTTDVIKAKAKNAASKINDLLFTAKKLSVRGATAAKNKLGSATTPLAVASVLAILIYGSYKTYQNYFSDAAKQCKSLTGNERIECIKRQRVDAIKEQIKDLERSKSACNNTTNPTKCKQQIDQKINNLKEKVNKILI